MRKNVFSITNYRVEEHKRVFVIAEAGVNHNGKLDMALQLVNIAADAKADAVKFQTFRPEQVVTEKGEMAEYQKRNLGVTKSQREMIKEFELAERHYPAIIRRCKKRGILFLSTPHGGRASVRFLESLQVPAYKVGSGDLSNYILLDEIAKTKKPVILSSGMATLKEITRTLSFLRGKGCKQISVLHCTTDYPCPHDEVDLNAMTSLMKKLRVPIGYSDHTLGNQVAIMATTLGASIYECHFTISKTLPGPDHIGSAEPHELKEKIQAIRQVEIIMGSSEKKPSTNAKSFLPLVTRSIVANKPMKKGHILQEDDIEAKRPGDGVSPTQFEKFLGKTLQRDVTVDEQLQFRDIT